MKLITATFMLAFAATSFAVEPHNMDKESSAQQFNPLGYLFDNLRCVAVGKGKRVADKETITWEWLSSHKSTRITQRLDNNRALVVERCPIADGSVMEDRREMHRRK